MSKRLGWIIGCKDKTSSWYLIGCPDGHVQQYHVGEIPTGIPYTYTNRHAETPSKRKTEDAMSLDRAQSFPLSLGSDRCQYSYIHIPIILAIKQVAD